MKHNRSGAMLLFVLLGAICVQGASRHLIKKIHVPGDYGWDYLTADSDGRRLYVSHDHEVVVLDLDTGAIVGKIPGEDVHGIAIVRDLGRGFISATDPGSITIFDLKTLAVIQRVPVGADPNAIFFDPKIGRVFSADRGSKRIPALDPKTGKVSAPKNGTRRSSTAVESPMYCAMELFVVPKSMPTAIPAIL